MSNGSPLDGGSLEEFGFPHSTIDDINIGDTDNAIIGASSCRRSREAVLEQRQYPNETGKMELQWSLWSMKAIQSSSVRINSTPITLTFPVPGEYEVSLAIENYCGTTDTTIVIVVNDEIETVWQCGDPIEYQG